MTLYKNFAYIYKKGQHFRYSEMILQVLPSLLKKYSINPTNILDMACGQGNFCIGMAKRGYDIAGFDLSPEMLEYARLDASEQNLDIEFYEKNMCSFNFEGAFDLITSWYDSVNYILDFDDLKKVFKNVASSLKEGGYFIFDINTPYFLTCVYPFHPCHIRDNSEEVMELHLPTFDFETKICTFKIVGFYKEDEHWTRIEEDHQERAYSFGDFKTCLQEAGLKEIGCVALNHQKMASKDVNDIWGAPNPKSTKVFFIAQK